MKKLFVIVLLINAFVVNGQTEEAKLILTVKEFHQALVAKNAVSINQQTDKALSYGHSNGWIETKAELIQHLEAGVLTYNSIKEDSIQVAMNGAMANVRLNATINVTMDGKSNTYNLKVLEVWVKKGKRWILFARQAVKR